MTHLPTAAAYALAEALRSVPPDEREAACADAIVMLAEQEQGLVPWRLRRGRNAYISLPAIPVIDRRAERGPRVRRISNAFCWHCQQHF
jgi:hypothetical protein